MGGTGCLTPVCVLFHILGSGGQLTTDLQTGHGIDTADLARGCMNMVCEVVCEATWYCRIDINSFTVTPRHPAYDRFRPLDANAHISHFGRLADFCRLEERDQ